MEEGNIEEHTNYLVNEEEKRRRARLIRTAVEGPVLRWVSKTEKIKVVVEAARPPSQPAPAPPPLPSVPTPIRPATVASAPSTMTYQYGYSYPNMPRTSTSQTPPAYSNATPPYYPYATLHQPQVASPSTSTQPTFVYHSYPQTLPVQAVHVAEPAPPAPPVERIETVATSYVVHELEQEDGTPKPLWKDTMAAMFGDHVKWEDLRVYTGKGRPTSTYSILVSPWVIAV